MTIESQCCRNMLLKDHSSSLGMDYVETKRRSSFARRILLVTVVTALLIFMVKQPSNFSGSTKVTMNCLVEQTSTFFVALLYDRK